jgi:predicted dehydrogenase
MQQGEWSRVTALASRNLAKAKEAARALGVAKAYGSYEELLADPEVEAVYNPLPNHLHVPWTIKAAEAGKHVLCEKPIALTAEEAGWLLAAANRTGVRIQEAFMVRTHPQWAGVLEMINAGRVGEVRSMMGFFSYYNRDAQNIRNNPEYGGGGLLDIGCYLINVSRFIFRGEPKRVSALIDWDPDLKVDRLTSFILDFPSGQAIFTCGTQITPYQRVHIFGTDARIEVEIPFNAPSDHPCRVFVDKGGDLLGGATETLIFTPANQYTIQGDLFSRAIRENSPAPIPLEDSIKNMAVIEALFRSGQSGRWETPAKFGF